MRRAMRVSKSAELLTSFKGLGKNKYICRKTWLQIREPVPNFIFLKPFHY